MVRLPVEFSTGVCLSKGNNRPNIVFKFYSRLPLRICIKMTKFSVKQIDFVYVYSALGSLYRVDMGDVTEFSEVHAGSKSVRDSVFARICIGFCLN
jgi:hypothetical protein